MKLTTIAARIGALALAAMPVAAQACDQCMGGKDPTIRPAINGAIFFMLGLVAMMATGMGLFMRYLLKRAKAQPDAEFLQLMTMPEGPNHV